ncbi:MAG: hypothetical protein ACRDFQ_04655 [Anaerolineales bacterium]
MKKLSSLNLRAAGIVWMLVFLIWLPFEDTQTGFTVVLAAAGVFWLVLKQRFDWRGGWLGAGAWGAALGTAVPLAAVALMAFKGGIHRHGFADFSARQVLGVLELLPICIVTGIGVALLMKRVVSHRNDLPHNSLTS